MVNLGFYRESAQGFTKKSAGMRKGAIRFHRRWVEAEPLAPEPEAIVDIQNGIMFLFLLNIGVDASLGIWTEKGSIAVRGMIKHPACLGSLVRARPQDSTPICRDFISIPDHINFHPVHMERIALPSRQHGLREIQAEFEVGHGVAGLLLAIVGGLGVRAFDEQHRPHGQLQLPANNVEQLIFIAGEGRLKSHDTLIVGVDVLGAWDRVGRIDEAEGSERTGRS